MIEGFERRCGLAKSRGWVRDSEGLDGDAGSGEASYRSGGSEW